MPQEMEDKEDAEAPVQTPEPEQKVKNIQAQL